MGDKPPNKVRDRSPRRPSGNAAGRSFVWLIFFTVVVRGTVLWLGRQSLCLDPDGYRLLAKHLIERHSFALNGFPTAFRPPLYPLLLAPAAGWLNNDRLAIALLHLILGVATVAVVYFVARSARFQRGAVLAGMLVALDPVLLYWSTFVMTETLATLLAVVCLLALHQTSIRPSLARAGLAGACLGTASLCRPAFLPWFVLCFPALVMCGGGRWPERLGRGLALVAGCGLLILPWAIRNELLFGKPIFTTTHGGYTLLLGNNPDFYAYLRSGSWGAAWQPDQFFSRYAAEKHKARGPQDELRNDRHDYEQARSNIRQSPAMFVYASLVRVARLWSPLPHRISANERPARMLLRWAAAAWYAAEYGLALLGIWTIGARWGKSPWIWAVLLAVAVTAVHAIYWSNLRMRAPLVPAIALAAAAGAERLRNR